MKKILVLFFIFNLTILSCFFYTTKVYCDNQIEIESSIINDKGSEVKYTYLIYDDEDNLLDERVECFVGDQIIDKNFNVYEVYFIDEEFCLARAKIVDKLEKDNIVKYQYNKIAEIEQKNSIGLYLTHNDESYLIGDGSASIYGAGGIHDIAKKLAKELQKYNINVILDETLHIPHDSYAYSRSKSTAKKLLSQDVDAIFDIHRDGVARVNYVTMNEGEERCQVRIVVGKNNANMKNNLEFAKYLFQIGNEFYPWLFKDIYLAKNTYNQNLSSKCLLFEMGTHTIEKEMVLDSTHELAKVLNMTLFNTTIDETEQNLIINGDVANQQTLNDYLEEQNKENFGWYWIVLGVIIIVGVGILIKKNTFKFRH